ncbi:MAG: carboxypeptidase-like regulatory domain-containing protein [Sphingobacteriales bacterium]|nr:MAG: carboxypeptidase-like regulatory domain-containing protein [Sphingobacteriales bacterium]
MILITFATQTVALKRILLVLLTLLCCKYSYAQQQIRGTVADAETSQPLPFATIKHEGSSEGIITDINGRFSFTPNRDIKRITVSYIGYKPAIVAINQRDTIFLEPLSTTFNEVIIRPPYDKIKRIVNRAIDSKSQHNPDQYDWYSCHIYYKMKVDMLPAQVTDSQEANLKRFSDASHLILSETYSKRYYKRPQKTQDIVLASRFSGLKKSLFTSLVTDVLPFHVYGSYITLNEVDYLHPIAPGWQSRYEFDIVDELTSGNDTIYILKYKQKKGKSFNALRGTVYINTNGYAISHMIAYNADTASRQLKMEQIYQHTGGKWFPKELNYELWFKKFPDPNVGMTMNGHSIIDSVSFIEDKSFKFDKAHSLKLDKRIDERTADEWETMRFDSLNEKEKNTYKVIDSIAKENNLEGLINVTAKAATGRIPVGPVDIELKRLLAYNTYEGTRLGLGLYTNEKVSKYYSVGGWFGYGFKDKVMKYGGSARVFPTGVREHWIEAAYQKTYQNTGNINIHPELDRNGLRNWLLARVDEIHELSGTLHGRLGYWETELQTRRQLLTPRYDYVFNGENNNGVSYTHREAAINLRYAYAEKRTPLFDTYLPLESKYPILYLRLSGGNITSGLYNTNYTKALASATFRVRINRLGHEHFRVYAGIVQTMDNKSLPRSFLMAGNGFRIDSRIQLDAWGGFLTLLPFTYFSDKFVSLHYKHDFDRSFYEHKYSKPYLSLAHNMLYGSLNKENLLANTGITSPTNGYHESGIMLNQLLRFEYLNIAYINLNAGVYYHWAPTFDFGKHGRFVVGVSANL